VADDGDEEEEGSQRMRSTEEASGPDHGGVLETEGDLASTHGETKIELTTMGADTLLRSGGGVGSMRGSRPVAREVQWTGEGEVDVDANGLCRIEEKIRVRGWAYIDTRQCRNGQSPVKRGHTSNS
jgi:hypothetical protein